MFYIEYGFTSIGPIARVPGTGKGPLIFTNYPLRREPRRRPRQSRDTGLGPTRLGTVKRDEDRPGESSMEVIPITLQIS